jgi:CheY-like chemotaxis protein
MNSGSSDHPLHRVLIVDDDQIEREMLVELLTAPNRSVEAFGSGNAALEFLNQNAVDFALLDHVMPGLSGIELAGKIKVMYPDARIIMCSGYLIEASNPKLLEQADQVLHKPLNLGQILHLADADAAR